MSSKQGVEEIGTEGAPLSWDDFKQKIQADIAEYKNAAASVLMHSPWIYRGQSNSTWVLKTSLERYLEDELELPPDKIPVRDYYVKLSAIVPAINSLTGRKFEDFNPLDIVFSEKAAVPECELLCYARHHGFPTPLLDWTESYYVAAFFAFWSIKKHQKENVSVYAYKEWNGKARSWGGADPRLCEMGHYIETHSRHYKQQSNYTVCLHRASVKDPIYFVKHEDALARNPDNQRMKKFIISAKEKERALEELYAMNINTHTLFGDEEALLRMLAYKEFVLRGK